MPAHPFSYADKEVFLPAFKSMGLSLVTVPLAINSRAFGARPSCSAFGTCLPMCPIGAKYNALVHIRLAESTGKAVVRPNCHVRRIRLKSSRRADYVEFVNERGVVERQSANAFVLAAGAVEVPRLLLLSANDTHAAGLANSSGLVGRNFMVRPAMHVAAKLPERLGPHRNGFPTAQSWALYDHRSLPKIGNALLYIDESSPTPAEIALESSLWGSELQKRVQEIFGFQATLRVFGEMLPKPENFVALGSAKDTYGDPVPSIKMSYGDFEHRSLARGAQVSQQLFARMAGTEIRKRAPGMSAGHLMGTTKMGKDPTTSVCDEWGRCHDLDNLFVASGSLFPSVGCSGPTLTIAALALRTGDFLARNA
jgi:choline dehydrogenase-like flavoprotein